MKLRIAPVLQIKALAVLFSLGLPLLTAGVAQALPLYLGDVQGALRIADTSDGSSDPLFAYGLPLPPNAVAAATSGLSARAGDATHLYTLVEYAEEGAAGDPFGALVEIDLVSQTATAFAPFDASALGFTHSAAAGALAIDPLNPDIAVVSGVDYSLLDFFIEEYLWKVDVTTGAVVGPAVAVDFLYDALTYSLDGSTLYASRGGQLYTLDPDSGFETLLGGDPALSNHVTGLAFAPDGTLYAIDADSSDRLVILDAMDGSIVEILGHTGIIGPEGLAFVPEPASFALVAIASFVLAWGRRRGA